MHFKCLHDAWHLACREPTLPIIIVIIIIGIFVVCQVTGLLKETIHIEEQYGADKGVV